MARVQSGSNPSKDRVATVGSDQNPTYVGNFPRKWMLVLDRTFGEYEVVPTVELCNPNERVRRFLILSLRKQCPRQLKNKLCHTFSCVFIDRSTG
jgi:hypothetical protein